MLRQIGQIVVADCLSVAQMAATHALLLYVITTDPCRLIVKVEQKPQLEAGIRDRQTEPVVVSHFDGIGVLVVDVAVEHAPDLRIRTAKLPSPFLSFARSCFFTAVARSTRLFGSP